MRKHGIAGRVVDSKIAIADRRNKRVIEFEPGTGKCVPILACACIEAADIRFGNDSSAF